MFDNTKTWGSKSHPYLDASLMTRTRNHSRSLSVKEEVLIFWDQNNQVAYSRPGSGGGFFVIMR